MQTEITSQRLAEMCGKRHARTKRSIETMLRQGLISKYDSFEQENEQNKSPETIFIFNQHQSFIIMQKLSPKNTELLSDYWSNTKIAIADNSRVFVINMPDAWDCGVLRSKNNAFSSAYIEPAALVVKERSKMGPKPRIKNTLSVADYRILLLKPSTKNAISIDPNPAASRDRNHAISRGGI